MFIKCEQVLCIIRVYGKFYPDSVRCPMSDQLTRDRYLKEAYKLEASRIPTFFRFGKTAKRAVKCMLIVAIMIAVLSLSTFCLSMIGDGASRLSGLHELCGRIAPQISLGIFAVMMTFLAVVTFWCEIANNYKYRAYEKASRFASQTVEYNNFSMVYDSDKATFLRDYRQSQDTRRRRVFR